MQTEYKYIIFQKAGGKFATKPTYRCLNKKSNHLLGIVAYYQYWKQYCFMPEAQTVFSEDCLCGIQHFLSQLQGGGEYVQKDSS